MMHAVCSHVRRSGRRARGIHPTLPGTGAKPMPGPPAPTARWLGEQAMAAAYAKASEAWRREARRAIEDLARHRASFIAWEVWQLLAARGIETPNGTDGRAMGPLLRYAARKGICARTSETRPTDRVSRHGTEERVWRSLL